jgi:ribonuclease HII
MQKPDLWELERSCYARGWGMVCGADEAGAGPLAGPVYAAAVILPLNWAPKGLNDSKKLTPKTRDRLFEEITSHALAFAVASVDEETIDEINILNARLHAMDQAIRALVPKADFALIDGDKNRGIAIANMTVVHGDGLSASIAAASILAKVSRDRYMEGMDLVYPQYGFARHKGYGTKEHLERLHTFGACAIHRRTFLKNL